MGCCQSSPHDEEKQQKYRSRAGSGDKLVGVEAVSSTTAAVPSPPHTPADYAETVTLPRCSGSIGVVLREWKEERGEAATSQRCHLDWLQILSVREGSTAAAAGLKRFEGKRLTHVCSAPVNSLEELHAAMEGHDEITLRIGAAPATLCPPEVMSNPLSSITSDLVLGGRGDTRGMCASPPEDWKLDVSDGATTEAVAVLRHDDDDDDDDVEVHEGKKDDHRYSPVPTPSTRPATPAHHLEDVPEDAFEGHMPFGADASRRGSSASHLSPTLPCDLSLETVAKVASTAWDLTHGGGSRSPGSHIPCSPSLDSASDVAELAQRLATAREVAAKLRRELTEMHESCSREGDVPSSFTWGSRLPSLSREISRLDDELDRAEAEASEGSTPICAPDEELKAVQADESSVRNTILIQEQLLRLRLALRDRRAKRWGSTITSDTEEEGCSTTPPPPKYPTPAVDKWLSTVHTEC
eukprot:Sspe_Gene.58990::Locus_32396_Transcript_1_1_Confidence_1.000_Length_2093::g.58990::m.58990